MREKFYNLGTMVNKDNRSVNSPNALTQEKSNSGAYVVNSSSNEVGEKVYNSSLDNVIGENSKVSQGVFVSKIPLINSKYIKTSQGVYLSKEQVISLNNEESVSQGSFVRDSLESFDFSNKINESIVVNQNESKGVIGRLTGGYKKLFSGLALGASAGINQVSAGEVPPFTVPLLYLGTFIASFTVVPLMGWLVFHVPARLLNYSDSSS